MGKEDLLRGIILVILLFIAAIFIYKGIFLPIDEYGTKEINLVNKIYENYDELLAGAEKMAQEIADNSPLETSRICIYDLTAYPPPCSSMILPIFTYITDLGMILKSC